MKICGFGIKSLSYKLPVSIQPIRSIVHKRSKITLKLTLTMKVMKVSADISDGGEPGVV